MANMVLGPFAETKGPRPPGRHPAISSQSSNNFLNIPVFDSRYYRLPCHLEFPGVSFSPIVRRLPPVPMIGRLCS
ncbi:MAG TPA: hypothetical protein DD706_01070 [Nitrospiraceae bacterium]|nr:hypothetical protein [Nitrospiraceae bacterium]